MKRSPRPAIVAALTAFLIGSAAFLPPARAGFPTPPLTLRAASPQAGAQFGYAAASADVNNDGFADVIVAAPLADFNDHADRGEVTVLLGPSLTTSTLLHAPVPEDGSLFGRSVAAADFDGDGFADIAVGSPFATVASHAESGKVDVFFGPSLNTSITINNPQPDFRARFGSALSAADVNGDGVADLLVGAPDATIDGKQRAGKAFVFLGPSLSTPVALQAPQPEAQTSFGRAVAGADIDRDGKDEVIVGAPDPGIDVLNPGPGLAYVFHGPSLDTVITVQDPQPQPGAFFGRAVAGGDFNGDGYDDLLVGAYGTDRPPCAGAGRAFVFTAPSFSSVTVLEQPILVADSAYFGYSLTAADVNHDGYADAVIGAYDADILDPMATGGGEANMFLGSSFQSVVRFLDPQPERFAYFSRSIVAADVNGDGNGDLIAGAPGSDVSGAADAGEAFAFFAESDPVSPPVGGIAESPEQFDATARDSSAHDDGPLRWLPAFAVVAGAAALATLASLRRRHA